MTVCEDEVCLYGLPISPGIAMGAPFFLASSEENLPHFRVQPGDIDKEIQRYKNAVECVEEDLIKLRQQLDEEHIFQGPEILETHQHMIKDPVLTAEVENQIRQTGNNAEIVFYNIVKKYQEKFNSLIDPFFRERFKDLQDISNRILKYLVKNVRLSLDNIPSGCILFARDLTPSDVVEAKRAHVKALVTLVGGATSHAAIVAKANGIPFITNIDFQQVTFSEDTAVIVDGGLGSVIVNPTEKTLNKYQQLFNEFYTRHNRLEKLAHLPAETYDGYSIRLSANIDVLYETEALHRYGGTGVGLFRSEYLFFSNEKFPDEQEQFESYKAIVEKMQGLPVVIRTFDIGIDKCMSQLKGVPELNPYLGCRAIRLLLREREIFQSQLRAIVKASYYGDVSVMFPMISSLNELQEAKKLLEKATCDVEKVTGKKIKPLRVGSMIEVPSAALISDLLARECDFLSIGTNDLVQYALAVDRDNHMLTSLYSPTHPCVIRLIKLIVHEASRYGIPVTVCGEVASDPRFIALLLGLGVNELSVTSRYIPMVKHIIRHTSILGAHKLVNKVMKLGLSHEIEELLTAEYKNTMAESEVYLNTLQS